MNKFVAHVNNLSPGPSPKERGDPLPFGEGWGGVSEVQQTYL